jgi:hypothetical protein
MPANGGLLRIGHQSPGSIFDRFQGENAESLWPHAGLFPFAGDPGWRLGSILTAWRSRQYHRLILCPARPVYAGLADKGIIEMTATDAQGKNVAIHVTARAWKFLKRVNWN